MKCQLDLCHIAKDIYRLRNSMTGQLIDNLPSLSQKKRYSIPDKNATLSQTKTLPDPRQKHYPISDKMSENDTLPQTRKPKNHTL